MLDNLRVVHIHRSKRDPSVITIQHRWEVREQVELAVYRIPNPRHVTGGAEHAVLSLVESSHATDCSDKAGYVLTVDEGELVDWSIDVYVRILAVDDAEVLPCGFRRFDSDASGETVEEYTVG
jgi:hypothetical protein